MAFDLIIKDKAIEETTEAYLYYESRLDGLGERFLRSLQERYDQIALNPHYFSFVDNTNALRDVKVEDFPFVVIYDVQDSIVTVYSVHNTYKNRE